MKTHTCTHHFTGIFLGESGLVCVCVSLKSRCYCNVDVVNLVLVQLQCEFVQLNLNTVF